MIFVFKNVGFCIKNGTGTNGNGLYWHTCVLWKMMIFDWKMMIFDWKLLDLILTIYDLIVLFWVAATGAHRGLFYTGNTSVEVRPKNDDFLLKYLEYLYREMMMMMVLVRQQAAMDWIIGHALDHEIDLPLDPEVVNSIQHFQYITHHFEYKIPIFEYKCMTFNTRFLIARL